MGAGVRPRILVAGGGIAAAETVLALDALAPGLGDIEILAPDEDMVLAPPSTAMPFGDAPPLHLSLGSLAAHADAGLRRGVVASVDTEHRVPARGQVQRVLPRAAPHVQHGAV